MIPTDPIYNKKLIPLFKKRKETKYTQYCLSRNYSIGLSSPSWDVLEKKFCIDVVDGNIIFFDIENKGIVEFIIPNITTLETHRDYSDVVLTGIYGIPVLCIYRNHFFIKQVDQVRLQNISTLLVRAIQNNKLKSPSKFLQIPYVQVFGSTVDLVMMCHFVIPQLEMPYFIYDACQYLSTVSGTEGIFRISGDAAEMDNIRKTIESGDALIFQKYSIHSITNTLKSFFREIPDGLINPTLSTQLLSAIQFLDPNDIIDVLHFELKYLPIPLYNILKIFCQLMTQILSKSEVNKMNEKNLLICLSPSLKINPILSRYILFCPDVYN
ncbi:RhoGAP domain containing protein [Entamoeba marina]